MEATHFSETLAPTAIKLSINGTVDTTFRVTDVGFLETFHLKYCPYLKAVFLLCNRKLRLNSSGCGGL
jgi:hypothetical protein